MIELTEKLLLDFVLSVMDEIPQDIIRAMPKDCLMKTLQKVLKDALKEAQPPVPLAFQLVAVQQAIDSYFRKK